MILIIGKRGSGKTTVLKDLVGKEKNYNIIIICDINNQFISVPLLTEKQLYNLKNQEYKQVYRIILYPDFFPIFIDLIDNLQNTLLVIDEMDFYDTSIIEFNRYLINSRHRGNELIATTRRILHINKLFVSQLDYLYTFKTSLPNDIKYISDFTDDNYIKKINMLKKYQYAIYDFT